jgi:hypothetical protein
MTKLRPFIQVETRGKTIGQMETFLLTNEAAESVAEDLAEQIRDGDGDGIPLVTDGNEVIGVMTGVRVENGKVFVDVRIFRKDGLEGILTGAHGHRLNNQ